MRARPSITDPTTNVGTPTMAGSPVSGPTAACSATGASMS